MAQIKPRNSILTQNDFDTNAHDSDKNERQNIGPSSLTPRGWYAVPKEDEGAEREQTAANDGRAEFEEREVEEEA